jgi:C-terminal processing protease CtpA/Prc
MRLTTAKFYSPRGLPYSRVGVEPDLAVHSAARPVEGAIARPAGDPAFDAAVDVARRAALRAAAPSKPGPRATAAR